MLESKRKRTIVETKLLTQVNELIKDVQGLKQRSDAKSHQNKHIVKQKIKIIQNKLASLRKERCSTYEPKYATVNLNSVEVRAFNRKIERFVENYPTIERFFIKISKKDIAKNRLNIDVLKSIIEKLGDTTWYGVDFPDTINRLANGKSKGLAFISYDKLSKEPLPKNTYISNQGTDGEYIDVKKKNVQYFEQDPFITTITLKEFLKTL
jgi:hypothetical protein